MKSFKPFTFIFKWVLVRQQCLKDKKKNHKKKIIKSTYKRIDIKVMYKLKNNTKKFCGNTKSMKYTIIPRKYW